MNANESPSQITNLTGTVNFWSHHSLTLSPLQTWSLLFLKHSLSPGLVESIFQLTSIPLSFHFFHPLACLHHMVSHLSCYVICTHCSFYRNWALWLHDLPSSHPSISICSQRISNTIFFTWFQTFCYWFCWMLPCCYSQWRTRKSITNSLWHSLSGDTLFCLTFMTPPTSAPTLPLTPSLTSPYTADSLENPLQYNSNASAPPLLTLTSQLRDLLPFFSSVIFSYSFLCRYISIMAPLSPTTLQS